MRDIVYMYEMIKEHILKNEEQNPHFGLIGRGRETVPVGPGVTREGSGAGGQM